MRRVVLVAAAAAPVRLLTPNSQHAMGFRTAAVVLLALGASAKKSEEIDGEAYKVYLDELLERFDKNQDVRGREQIDAPHP